MKILAVTLISLSLFASVASHAQTSTTKAPTSSLIKIVRSDSLQSNKGSAQYFTGSVQVQQLFPAYDPSRTSGGKVTFEAGARSAWHTHPFGQILIVTDGTGWIQQWGAPIEEIRKGDVIWIPAGVKHWHGATPSSAMTHIAIQEELNGKAVEWMEKVTDEQYHKFETDGRHDRGAYSNQHHIGSGPAHTNGEEIGTTHADSKSHHDGGAGAREVCARPSCRPMETPRPHATRSQHCYDLGPNRAQPND